MGNGFSLWRWQGTKGAQLLQTLPEKQTARAMLKPEAMAANAPGPQARCQPQQGPATFLSILERQCHVGGHKLRTRL